MTGQRGFLAAIGAAVLVAVSGCSAPDDRAAVTSSPSVAPPATPTPVATDEAGAGAGASMLPLEQQLTGAWHPEPDATTLASGLEAPWSIVRLDDGTTLVDERDTGVVKEIRADGSAGAIGTVPGVQAAGEGGLLGIEVYTEGGPAAEAGAAVDASGTATDSASTTYLYAYLTTASDNRVVRMQLRGSAGAYSLGGAQDIVTGIPKASNHNGGRIKFGPDGMLYITAGDANLRGDAQNTASLAGKILRVMPDGTIPADNPFTGSPVYSFGHRNPQGIAWGADGTMYAAEFGQNTFDELNVISAGRNYGWPTVEGIDTSSAGSGFVQPIVTWSTDDASPSGLEMIGDTLFMAALGGQKLFTITVGSGGAPSSITIDSFFDGTFGRIRDVTRGPGESVLLLTNNTDGRGDPQPGDDRLLGVGLVAGAAA